MAHDREEEIQRRAHAMWELEGRPEGRHEEHWRQAVAEVDGGRGDGASSAAGGDVPARGEVPGLDVFESMPAEGSKP